MTIHTTNYINNELEQQQYFGLNYKTTLKQCEPVAMNGIRCVLTQWKTQWIGYLPAYIVYRIGERDYMCV